MMKFEDKVKWLSGTLIALLLLWGLGEFFSPERVAARSETSTLLAGKATDAADISIAVGASAVHLVRTLTRPGFVRSLKARGFAVNVWTVDDATEARDLAALGVDALITDAPGEIRAALEG